MNYFFGIFDSKSDVYMALGKHSEQKAGIGVIPGWKDKDKLEVIGLAFGGRMPCGYAICIIGQGGRGNGMPILYKERIGNKQQWQVGVFARFDE